jgi:hypothetical protein
MVDHPSRRSHSVPKVVAALSLLAVIGICVVEIAGQWRTSREPSPAPLVSPAVWSSLAREERITAYMGEAVCRECHPGEVAQSRRSGHHRTLWRTEQGRNPVVAWLDGKQWNDPELPEVTWSYHVRDGKLLAERTNGHRVESSVLDYGFGSGTHGVTFVSLEIDSHPDLDPSGIEHRLSYFSGGDRMGMTPGQDSPEVEQGGQDPVSFGRRLSPDRLQRCFGCHSTLTSTLARNRLEPATLIPNVSCERCHGPARAHVERARRGETDLTMPMGHEGPEPSVEIRLCGECHRLPKDIAQPRLRPDNLRIVRFQPVGLSMSACYADGLSGLRCTSCHDPHDRVSIDRAAYEATCLSCHPSGSKQMACPISPMAQCIDCHMPRRKIAKNGDFTDHWIRKPDPAANQRADHPHAEAVRPSVTRN